MDTLLDDLLSSLTWALTTKVCDTILRDDDLHRVLAVVEVGDHGHEGRDLAILSCRGSGEDREVTITCEVTRATDTIHHTGTIDVRGVDVTEDVGLQSCIDRDDTETANDLRVIRVLLWTKEELVLEEV